MTQQFKKELFCIAALLLMLFFALSIAYSEESKPTGPSIANLQTNVIFIQGQISILQAYSNAIQKDLIQFNVQLSKAQEALKTAQDAEIAAKKSEVKK